MLLLDIDGVLNPFAAAHCPVGYTGHDVFPGEEPVRLCRAHGDWIAELTGPFEVVWASAWGRSANAQHTRTNPVKTPQHGQRQMRCRGGQVGGRS